MPREELDELKVRDRLAGRVGVERVPERIPAVAPNRRLDPSAARARASDDEREIVALELTAAHERLQPAMRLLRARRSPEARRGSGRAARRLRRQERVASRTRGGRAALRSAATSASNNAATPTTMKLSARLNAGQYFKSRKSVTCPSRTRSIRLETLPPMTSPSATGSTGWRELERAKK